MKVEIILAYSTVFSIIANFADKIISSCLKVYYLITSDTRNNFISHFYFFNRLSVNTLCHSFPFLFECFLLMHISSFYFKYINFVFFYLCKFIFCHFTFQFCLWYKIFITWYSTHLKPSIKSSKVSCKYLLTWNQ